MSRTTPQALESPGPTDFTGLRGRFSPLRFLVITIGGIFLAEVIAMTCLLIFKTLPYYLQTLIDAGIMLVLISPIIYYFSLRPLLLHIENRQKAEVQLREMALFPTLNPDAVLQVDATGHIIKSNPSAAQMGLSVGGHLTELIPDLSDLDLPECIIEGTTQHMYEARLGERVLQWTIRGAPQLGLAFLYSQDITERKQSEEAIRLLSSVVEQTADTVVVTDCNGVIEYVNPAVENITGYVRQDILGKTPRVLKSGVHGDQFYNELWRTILKGEVFHGEMTNRTKNGELLHEVKTITPLRDAQGNITHFVATGKNITDRKEAEEKLRVAYDEMELRVQQRTEELRIANSDLEDEINVRRRVEEALRFSEMELRNAQEVARIGNWKWNLETREITWSDEMYRIFGIDKNSYTGRLGDVIARVIHPDDLHLVLPSNAKPLAEKEPIEYRILLPDKSIRNIWAKSGEAILDDSGKPVFLTGIAQDITDRKQAEEALRQNEATLRGILNATKESIWLFGADGTILMANETALVRVARPAEEIVGEHFSKFMPREVAEQRQKYLMEVVETGRSVEFEDERAGMIFHHNFYPVHDADGTVHQVVSFSRDITERQKIEKALRDSEQRLNRAQEIAHLGSWELDLLNNKLAWSDEVYRIFGLQPQEFAATYEAFLESVYPDDRSAVDQAYVGSIRDDRDTYEIEHRVVKRSNGDIRIVHEKCEHFRNEAGEIIRSVGMVHDITERKQAEEQLARVNQKLNEILASIQDDFYVLDRDWNFVYASRLFTTKVGKEPQDFVGHNIWEMFPKHVGTILEENFCAAMEKREVRRFEMGGKYTSAWYRMTAFPSAEGITVIGTDITDRKKAEEQLRYQAALLSNVNDAIVASDSLYHITAWNAAAEVLYGWKADEVVGHNGVEILRTEWAGKNPDDMRQAIAETGKWRGEATQIRKDGTRFFVEVSSIVLYDNSGDVAGYISVNRDITERKKAERELKQVNRTLKALSESNQIMMRAVSETEYLDQVCKVIVNDCGHLMVWIGYAEDDANRSVHPVASAGFEAGYLETLKITWADNERGQGPTGTAIRTGKPSRCRNMLTDPQFEPWRADALKRGYASSIVLPLLYEGKTMGALNIYSREPDPFSEDEERLLTELAGDLAYGVASIRLREALARTAESLSKAHDELELRVQQRTEELAIANRELLNEIVERREIERQLRIRTAAMESAANGILITDPSGNIMWTNPALTQMSGYSENELLGQNTRIFQSGRHGSEFYAGMWSTILSGNVWKGETINRRKDGSQYIEGQTITPVRNEDGEISHFIAIKEDITERKRIEAEIQERNRKEKDLMQMIHTMQVDIARDLHDTIGQNIGYLRMKLDYMVEKDLTAKGADLKSEFSQMSQVANESYDLVRGTLAILQSQSPDDLLQLFKRYASQIVERSGLEIEFTSQGEAGFISTHQMRQLFYIFREALSNIEKYSGAGYVLVNMKWGATTVELSIEDDGKGFDVSLIAVSPGHYGLRFMRERTEMMNGSFQVKTELGRGTRIIITVPIQRDDFEK